MSFFKDQKKNNKSRYNRMSIENGNRGSKKMNDHDISQTKLLNITLKRKPKES